MLRDTIFQRWRKATAASEYIQSLLPDDIVTARAFFRQLASKSLDEIRGKLSEADTRHNRILAWLLLNDAFNTDTGAEIDTVQQLIDWASFIAEYGDSLSNRRDALEGHCKFYKGVLSHRGRILSKANEYYARAELDYRNMGAEPLLQSLAVYALGVVALEQGNVEDDDIPDQGARSLFQKSLELVASSVPQEVKDEMQAAINYSLRQWQLTSDLIRDDKPDTLLEKNSEIVDSQLIELLMAQTLQLAYERQPAAEVVRIARLADGLSARLGQPAGAVETLLGYYLHFKRLEEAEFILREQLAARSDDLDRQKELARVLMLQSKHEQAQSLIEELLKSYPDDPELHGTLGALLMEFGDIERAGEHLHRALELNPQDSFAGEMIRHLEKRKPQALFSFEDGNLTIAGDINNLAPGDLAAAMTAAILAAKPERIDEELEEIARTDPGLAEKVARLLQARGLVASSPEPPAIQHYNRAEEFFRTAQWQKAIDEYRLAVEADPNFADAYMGWGDIYYRTGQYYLAIAYFEESISIKPSPFTYRFLGDSYIRIGNHRQAEKSYRQALEIDPNYVGARAALEDLLAARSKDNETVQEDN
jgi:tetratricopeptide (TPR) repeat protein